MESADTLLQNEYLVAGMSSDFSSTLFDAIKVCLRSLGWLNYQFICCFVQEFLKMTHIVITDHRSDLLNHLILYLCVLECSILLLNRLYRVSDVIGRQVTNLVGIYSSLFVCEF